MARNKGRRIDQVSWRMGSRNLTSVFNRRAKSPFARVKEIYGGEVQKLTSVSESEKLSFKKLSQNEKAEIRKRVKAQLRKSKNKEIIFGIIFFSLIIGTLLFIQYLNTKFK